MKIPFPNHLPSRPAQSGSAVVVILAMLGIMALLVASNGRTLNWLHSEVLLVDQRQTARLAASATNEVSQSPANPAPAP